MLIRLSTISSILPIWGSVNIVFGSIFSLDPEVSFLIFIGYSCFGDLLLLIRAGLAALSFIFMLSSSCFLSLSASSFFSPLRVRISRMISLF